MVAIKLVLRFLPGFLAAHELPSRSSNLTCFIMRNDIHLHTGCQVTSRMIVAPQQKTRHDFHLRAHKITMLVAAVLLIATTLCSEAQAMITDPTPEIHTANLPQGICQEQGNYLLADPTDNTSYYTCCGRRVTTVRKTCSYMKFGEGHYETLKAAPYHSTRGVCLNKRVRLNPKSFQPIRAENKSHTGVSNTELRRYRHAPTVANAEANITCRSAAAAKTAKESPRKRQQAPVNAAPQIAGQWKLIQNDAGVSSTGVVGISAVLLPESDKVLFWARPHMTKTNQNYEPGMMGPDGAPELSTVYDTNTGTYVAKKIRSMPVCTGQAVLPDGKILATGGDATTSVPGGKSKAYTNGLRGIRIFRKHSIGDWNKGFWTTMPSQLFSPRWYPTQILLPDAQRIVIIGGTARTTDSELVKTVEVYHRKHQTTFNETPLQFLQSIPFDDRVPRITYPAVYVLPFEPDNKGDVSMFMFSCDRGAIETIRPDDTWAEYVDINNWPTPGWCGATNMGGASTLLILEPENGYDAEVVMFGGFEQGKRQCKCDTPSSDWSHRLKLSKAAVQAKIFEWAQEKMPYARNLVDGVLLPDGKVLTVNGAKSGVVGNLRDPAYDAWMYDPKAATGSRFTTLATGTIKRFYHCTALLLPDASVLIAGSEFDECKEGCAEKTYWNFQHQAERFLPPYFFSEARPQIVSLSATELEYSGSVTVTYLGTVTGAVILTPGAVSHQVNSNQRGVKLEVAGQSFTEQTITFTMPPNSYVTQPGYHMIFVMNGDIPCTKAAWIRLTQK